MFQHWTPHPALVWFPIPPTYDGPALIVLPAPPINVPPLSGWALHSAHPCGVTRSNFYDDQAAWWCPHLEEAINSILFAIHWKLRAVDPDLHDLYF